MTVVPVTSQEPPLVPPPPSFSHSSTLRQLQGTPQASLGLLLSCHCVGQVLQLARTTSTTSCGQERQEAAEVLSDVGPVEGQASLEYTEVGNFYIHLCVYICMWSKLSCVNISMWTIYMVQVVVMCVSAYCPYVYNNRSYIVGKKRWCLRLKVSPCRFLSWQFEWGAKREFSH